MRDPVDDFLAHYGVKGMRWGRRKAKEVSSESRRTSPADDEASRQARAARKKKMIVAGSIIALGLIAAVGGYTAYKYDQNIKLDLLSRLQNEHDIGWRKKDDLAADVTNIKKFKKDIVDPINPNYGKAGTKVNCMRCTFAYELRRRGYDVRSTLARSALGEDQEQTNFGRHLATDKNNPFSPSRSGTFKSAEENFDKYAAAYQKSKVSDSMLGEKIIASGGSASQKASKLMDTLSKEPEGARGELGMSWFFGGHSVAWENVKGKPMLIDAQNGIVYDSYDKVKKLMEDAESIGYTRLDNKELNLDFLERWITDAKPK